MFSAAHGRELERWLRLRLISLDLGKMAGLNVSSLLNLLSILFYFSAFSFMKARLRSQKFEAYFAFMRAGKLAALPVCGRNVRFDSSI